MKYKLIQEGELFRIEETKKQEPITSDDCDCGMIRDESGNLILYTLIMDKEGNDMISQVEFSIPLFLRTTRDVYSCGSEGWDERFIEDMTELRDAIQDSIESMHQEIADYEARHAEY